LNFKIIFEFKTVCKLQQSTFWDFCRFCVRFFTKWVFFKFL